MSIIVKQIAYPTNTCKINTFVRNMTKINKNLNVSNEYLTCDNVLNKRRLNDFSLYLFVADQNINFRTQCAEITTDIAHSNPLVKYR